MPERACYSLPPNLRRPPPKINSRTTALTGARLRPPASVRDLAEYRVWRRRFYPFNVYSEKKRLEKLDYMHGNPVQ